MRDEYQKPLRCIVGARVSTDSQARDGISLTNQLDTGRAKVEEMGGIVVGYCIEEGVSGKRYDSRQTLQEAIAKIESKEADRLVYYDLSRLSRDTEFLLQIERRVARAGGEIVYCSAFYGKNSTGKMLKTIDVAIRTQERERLLEVSQENRIKRIRSGVQTQRAISPFGYKIVGRNDVIRGDFLESELGKYKIVEAEARWVGFIFERYAGGDSLRQICLALDEKGVACPKARRTKPIGHTGTGEIYGKIKPVWIASTVRVILSNPCYYGRPAFGRRTRVYDDSRLAKGLKTDYVLSNAPESEWIYLECEPIVSKEIFELCQERLKSNQKRGGRGDRKHPLTGLLRCPQCQHALTAYTHKVSKNSHRHRRLYRCRYSYENSLESGLCLLKRIIAEDVERVVFGAVESVTTDSEVLQEAFTRFRLNHPVADAAKDLQRARDALARNEKEMGVAIEAQLQARLNEIDPSIYESKLRTLSAEAGRLRERVKALAAALESAGQDKPMDFSQWASSIGQNVSFILRSPEVPHQAKHDLLARIIETIYPSPDGSLEIRFYPMTANTKLRLVWKGSSECGVAFFGNIA